LDVFSAHTENVLVLVFLEKGGYSRGGGGGYGGGGYDDRGRLPLSLLYMSESGVAFLLSSPRDFSHLAPFLCSFIFVGGYGGGRSGGKY
jgi:hypothetical protein